METLARRRVLIDRELRRIDAAEVAFAEGEIRYRDAKGRLATVDARSIVAMLPPKAGQAGPSRGIEWREIADVATGPQGRLELVDGQVIPGRLIAGEAKPEAVLWDHSLLGRLELPIERIATLVMKAGINADQTDDGPKPGAAGAGDERTNDVVTFTNGDAAKGVVESIALTTEAGALGEASTGTLVMDTAGKASTTPLDRVASVTFANAREAPSGVVAWLRDGTVVGGKTGEFGTQTLVLTEASLGGERAIEVPWDDVVGLNLDAGALVPLSACPMVEVKAGEGREWAALPQVPGAARLAGGVGDIELAGPVRVRWLLPTGTARAGMTASLPPSARAMGDCVLVVEFGGTVIRERLNGERPAIEIRLAPSGGAADSLIVTIESGEGGSIQDRVVLERGLLIVR